MTDQEQTKLDKLPPLQRSVTAILMALLNQHSAPDATDKSLNPRLGVDACLMVVAALIEVDSRNQTQHALDASTEGAAGTLRTMVQGLRGDFQKTGKHGLEQMGLARR